MNDETPMDLRSLGDVDSPEVVRDALRRFRRRSARSLVWVLLVVVVVTTGLVAKNVRRDLSERIDHAPGAVPGAVYRRDAMTAVLVKVADLHGLTGFHLIVSQPGTGPQHSTGLDVYELSSPDGSLVSGHGSPFEGRVYNLWFALRVPDDGRVTLTVELQCDPLPEQFNERGYGSCHINPPFPTYDPIVIDLVQLGIPRSTWHGGSR